jgi:hypothetical protein
LGTIRDDERLKDEPIALSYIKVNSRMNSRIKTRKDKIARRREKRGKHGATFSALFLKRSAR